MAIGHMQSVASVLELIAAIGAVFALVASVGDFLRRVINGERLDATRIGVLIVLIGLSAIVLVAITR